MRQGGGAINHEKGIIREEISSLTCLQFINIQEKWSTLETDVMSRKASIPFVSTIEI